MISKERRDSQQGGQVLRFGVAVGVAALVAIAGLALLVKIMELIDDLRAAKDAGRPTEELARSRNFQRQAQFYLDLVESENSTGFHAPQEAARILGESIDFARQGQNALRASAK